jgi:hypothetical protein
MGKDSWTTARITLLEATRELGAGIVCDALDKLPGGKLSRNAVCGKRARLFGTNPDTRTPEEIAAARAARREREAAHKRAMRAEGRHALGIGPQVQAINRRHERVAKHDRVGVPDGSLAFKVINGIKRQQKRAGMPSIDPSPFQCQDAADVVPLRLSLSDLERADGKCRWPYDALPDEPGEGSFRYCGHACLEGSYCFSHKLLSVGSGTNSERRATDISKVRAA